MSINGGDFRVYVANLNAYNNGELIGEWIDLPMDPEQLQAELDKIIKAGGGEEWAIHDYEVPYQGFHIDEYDNVFNINKVADLWLTDEEQFKKLVAYAQLYGTGDFDDLAEKAEDPNFLDEMDYYEGTLEDLAYRFVEEGLFENTLGQYFDIEAYARDLEIEGALDNYDEPEEDEDGEPVEHSTSDYIDFAQELLDSGSISEDQKRQYIDYEAIARDLSMDYAYIPELDACVRMN